ncbi:MAG: hypothetical protein PHN88_03055 [Ignavibacteria bacterium]|nr:hypothetical protein [Ignavibacteria bacterium]
MSKSDYLKIILGALITLSITLFLSDKARVIIRDFISYSFKSVWNHIYLAIISLIILCSTYFVFLDFYDSTLKYAIFITIYSIIIISIICCYSLYLSLFRKLNGNYIAIAGCFTIDTKGMFTIDSDSERISNLIYEKAYEYSKNHLSFSNNYFSIYNQIIPKFIATIIGINRVKKYLTWRIRRGDYNTVLYIIKNNNSSHLEYIIIANEFNFNTIDGFSNIGGFFSFLSAENKIVDASIIDASAMFYILVIGQSLLDPLMDNKDYEQANKLIMKSKELLDQCFKLVDLYYDPDNKILLNIRNMWSSQFEYYHGWYFYYTNNLKTSVQYFINALNINMYYPYESYDEFIREYTKQEVIEVTKTTDDIYNSMKNNKDNVKEHIGESRIQREEIIKSLKYRFPLTINILKSIIVNHQDEIKDLVKTIKDEYNKLEKNHLDNPLTYLFKYEIFKYMKKGSNKYNELYVERIPECKLYLKKCLELDEKYAYIYNKLGSILFIESLIKKDKTLLDEGMEYLAKGMHIYETMGLNIRNK